MRGAERTFRDLLDGLLGVRDAERLLARVAVPEAFKDLEPCQDVPRALVAQALNMVLLARSMSEVPDLARYAEEIAAGANPRRIFLDHGAVRSVRHVACGQLPVGQASFSRFLEPLGYREAETYPLPGLRMLGHAWRHEDYPEEVAQYFISELNVDAFSPEFQRVVARIVGTSKDPLSEGSKQALSTLALCGSLPCGEAIALIDNLVACFGRHHDPPRWDDYQRLLEESAEMAWIATEGHTFNHATDRIADVDAQAELERALGRRIKASVEVSSAGSVRQTAFEATTVWRPFLDDAGERIERPVPGSFFELISREQRPDGGGLDLRFDASNAQGIFAMTRR